jgi:hypothetical protein
VVNVANKRLSRPGPRRPTSPRPAFSGIWFLVGLVAAFGLLEGAARWIGPGATARSVLEQHEVGLDATGSEISVLFLGDSSVGAGIDPEGFTSLTGRHSYSLWLPDASAGVVEGLATDFAQAENVHMAVIGVTARMFNEATRPDRDRLLAEMAGSLPWQSRTDPGLLTAVEQIAADRLALVRYRAGLRRPTDWLVSYRSEANLDITDRGRLTYFLDQRVEELRDGYEAGERSALRDYAVSATETETLIRLVETLDRQGIQVSVVLLPLHGPVYDDLFPAGGADALFRRILAGALADQPATLIDLSDLGARPELFAGGNHLNRFGAEVLTGRVVQVLNVE